MRERERGWGRRHETKPKQHGPAVWGILECVSCSLRSLSRAPLLEVKKTYEEKEKKKTQEAEKGEKNLLLAERDQKRSARREEGECMFALLSPLLPNPRRRAYSAEWKAFRLSFFTWRTV